MNFNKNNFLIIKNVIDTNLVNFVYTYFLMKRQVARTMFDEKHISQFTEYFGAWNDDQVPNTYSHYSDIAMETLLLLIQPIIEKQTVLKLIPTYSYARIYKKGDVLHRHKDRFSCEISTTLNLGGDEWPIFIEKNPKKGIEKDNHYIASDSKGTKIILKPGDMLVYKGNLCEHWREPFEGENCVQVFLHYNNEATKGSIDNIYDGRPHLGLPGCFSKN